MKEYNSQTLNTLEELNTRVELSNSNYSDVRKSFIDDMLDLQGSLDKKIKEWEAKMDDDDTSLYSLGLRHARDEVNKLLKRIGDEE